MTTLNFVFQDSEWAEWESKFNRSVHIAYGCMQTGPAPSDTCNKKFILHDSRCVAEGAGGW